MFGSRNLGLLFASSGSSGSSDEVDEVDEVDQVIKWVNWIKWITWMNWVKSQVGLLLFLSCIVGQVGHLAMGNVIQKRVVSKKELH